MTIGENGLYTIDVSNVGGGPTTGVVTVVDTLPDGLTFVSGSGSGWTCSAVGQTVTCTTDTVFTPGFESSIELTVAVGEGAYPTVTNVAVVSTAGDVASANNPDSDPTTIRRPAQTATPTATPTGPAGTPTPSATVGAGTPTPPAPGTPTATPTAPAGTPTATPVLDIAMVKYNIGNFFTCQTGVFDYQVTNMGASAHQVTVGPITITETLPDGLIYVGYSGDGWTCSAVGQDMTCIYAPPLEPRAITMLHVTVYVGDEAYPTINSFATATTPFDDNPQNNYEQENTTVRRGPGDCSDRPNPPGMTPTPTPSATPTGPRPSQTPGGEATATPAPGCEVDVSTRYSGVPRPGATIDYRLTWSHACREALDVFLTQTLPDGMEVVGVDVLDAEVGISGNTVSIDVPDQGKGATSAVIRARVLPDTEVGETLCSTAVALDPYGRTSESEACLIVAGSGEQMRTSLHAHLLSKPGRELSYTARYFGVDADNSLVLELPENTSILNIQEPQPTSIEGRVLVWEDLPAPSGKVRVTVQVAYGLAQGTVLRAQMDFEDAVGREILQHETMVVEESSPSGESTIGDLSLTGARQLAAGLETKLALRYSKVAEVGDLILDLGPEIEYVDSNPPARVGSDGSLQWTIDGSPTVPASGGMKLKVRLKAGSPAGTLIRSIAALSTSNSTAVAEHLLVVKNTTNRRSTSTATLKTPKTVVPGLQTQIGVSVKKMPAPVTIDLTLPPDVTPTLSIPGSVVTETGKLRWTFAGEPGKLISASVKVKVLIDAGVAPGALLSTTATISSPLGTTSSSGVMTAKGGVSSGGGPISTTRDLTLDLTGATNVEAGLGTTLKLSYKYLSDNGRLEVELPPGISLVESTVPKANDIADGRLAWIGLPAPSGSVQIKALVHPSVTVGQVLTTRATLTDPNGTVATDTLSASVR